MPTKTQVINNIETPIDIIFLRQVRLHSLLESVRLQSVYCELLVCNEKQLCLYQVFPINIIRIKPQLVGNKTTR